MLNDLNPKDYRNIYIVCGFTDMRYGINGLSAIIEQKYKMNVYPHPIQTEMASYEHVTYRHMLMNIISASFSDNRISYFSPIKKRVHLNFIRTLLINNDTTTATTKFTAAFTYGLTFSLSQIIVK